MATTNPKTGNQINDVGAVVAAPIGLGLSKRITATVNTTLVISPPIPPVEQRATGDWSYLKVSVLTADVWVSVAIDEAPALAPSADPGVAGDWEPGYDVIGGGSEMIPLSGPFSAIHLLSSASADVILNLVA
jgi:hypothetical protein